jgi:hypothetical protein
VPHAACCLTKAAKAERFFAQARIHDAGAGQGLCTYFGTFSWVCVCVAKYLQPGIPPPHDVALHAAIMNLIPATHCLPHTHAVTSGVKEVGASSLAASC